MLLMASAPLSGPAPQAPTRSISTCFSTHGHQMDHLKTSFKMYAIDVLFDGTKLANTMETMVLRANTMATNWLRATRARCR